MSSTYTLYEDDQIVISTTEQSSTFDLTVCVKSTCTDPSSLRFQTPRIVIELYNDAPISAAALAEFAYQTLYAASLQLDESSLISMKEKIRRL